MWYVVVSMLDQFSFALSRYELVLEASEQLVGYERFLQDLLQRKSRLQDESDCCLAFACKFS